MNIDHNRIKVADLEKNQPNKILTTNDNGELEFSDINNIKTESYNALDYTAEGKALDARQGKILKDLIDTINVLLASDNINLNTIQELANAIETIQNSLSTILVNDLTTGDNTKAATAETVKTLKGLVDSLTAVVNGKQDSLTDANFGSFQSALPTVTTIADADKLPMNIGGLARMMSWLNFKALFKTVGGVSLFGSGDISTGSGDMTTTTAQTVSGLKTFLNGMIGFRNSANTFTNLFSIVTTAARTWTWPDKNGTIAMTSDIVAQLNGTVNKLVKFGTTTTGTDSRITDTGTYIGIGTQNTPTKDITLGNQANRDIGIERSESNSAGKDLTVSAGITVNYSNGSFIPLNQANLQWLSLGSSNNGDVYALAGQDIYKQTGGTGNFVALGQAVRTWSAISGGYSNNDMYACVNGGDIYKQTGGTGNFVALGQTARAWSGITVASNGDVYACVNGGDIYKQTGGTGNFVALGQTALGYTDMASGLNGNVFASVKGGNIYMQTGGTGNFVTLGQTARAWSGLSGSRINNDIYACVESGDIYKQTGGTGNFVALGVSNMSWQSITVDKFGNVYSGVNYYDIFYQRNDSLGIANLDGGTLKVKAGTGKGTGKSRIEFVTGQKTVSGTDMQVETLRGYFDEKGNFVHLSTPVYANDAAADSDTELPSGAYYKITGNRTLFQKP